MNRIVVREDVERKNFEAWCKAISGDDHLEVIVDEDGNVEYEDVCIEFTWQGWLARAYESAKEKQGAEK